MKNKQYAEVDSEEEEKFARRKRSKDEHKEEVEEVA